MSVLTKTDIAKGLDKLTNTFKVRVGEKVLLRTVMFAYTGEIKSVTKTYIYLSDAAWIPLTGRFSECLKTGVTEECEPLPGKTQGQLAIARASIVDVIPWSHDLPRTVK